ncbi:Rhodanese-like domain containing protein [Trema orientale]|uniref:Rhodanese-like domain containing protein n=1 Tax=Trema orientale TaxID=63057 RepID=A0A2P5F089_TREOI|nr:Rhodanese-like domain containing protein [Trema orientale]
MRGSVVVCSTLSSTVTPIHAANRRIDSLRFFRLCFATTTTSITHGKRFLSLVSRTPKPNKDEAGGGSFVNRVRVSVQCRSESEEDDFVVVNFYRFVFIKDPKAEVAKHLAFMQGLDIHGRIYVNEQGINAQYSGPSKDALAYVEWLKEDDRFSDILVQVSPAINGHAFPKLKLRYKPSLFEGGAAHLSLLDPSMQATQLEPSEWRKRLEAANPIDDPSNENSSSSYILLDVRNGYEWDIGHFDGARRPDVDCFRSTSFGLSQPEDHSGLIRPVESLTQAGVEQQGFKNLYTLAGGISHYLKNEGPVKWTGNLFVFDSRLSLTPSYKPEAMSKAISKEEVFRNNAFASCYICGSQVSELRHRNCANLDCNLLFLCCTDCVNDLKGCCCVNCTTAPRLRPVLPEHQRYKKWHIYRDSELLTKLTAPSAS